MAGSTEEKRLIQEAAKAEVATTKAELSVKSSELVAGADPERQDVSPHHGSIHLQCKEEGSVVSVDAAKAGAEVSKSQRNGRGSCTRWQDEQRVQHSRVLAGGGLRVEHVTYHNNNVNPKKKMIKTP